MQNITDLIYLVSCYQTIRANKFRLPLARSDMGLSTVIGGTNKDARWCMLSPIDRFRTRAYTSKNKNLTQAFTQLDTLDTLIDKLGLSDFVVEKTAYIFRKAEEIALLSERAIFSPLLKSMIMFSLVTDLKPS